MRVVVRVALLVIAASSFVGDPASAAVLEEKIVFSSNRDGDYDLYSMDPNGSNVVQLTNTPRQEFGPSISPDGTRIAFTRSEYDTEGDIVVINADGSGETVIGHDIGKDPDWSPDGTRIAYGTEGHGAPDGVWTMKADGTDRRNIAFVDRSDVEPSWAPDNSRIVFATMLNFDETMDGLYTVAPDGTGLRQIARGAPEGGSEFHPDFRFDSAKIAIDGIGLLNPDGSSGGSSGISGYSDPSWSPKGTHLAFVRQIPGPPPEYRSRFVIYRDQLGGGDFMQLTPSDGFALDPVWGRLSTLTGPGYPRPKGATPMRIPLVPAAEACASPNRTHGGPLAFESCAPPDPSSAYATTGTPDSNGLGAQMNAYVVLGVAPGDPNTEADESDVNVTVHVNNVFRPSDLADYTGELRANLPIRITDRDNLPSVGGPGPGTTQPFPFGFDVPCSPTVEVNVGSNCTLTTTIDTLVPGAIRETRRAIWQVGQVRVFDGGADGDGSTAADNTVFAVQGVFIP